ncbi:MAG: hypothetical protein ACFFE2_04200 [Candidatus Thorarchaeota archaeon]
MHLLEEGRNRIRQVATRVDKRLLRAGKHAAKTLVEYRLLISVLLIGFIVWAIVFNIAVIDYTNTNNWHSRSAWLGPFPNPGTVQIFGYTVEYQIEGYSDYSFYYVHWGYNSLFGVMPYSGDYGVLEMDGITNRNGAHMFPPFTSYLYAAGIALSNFMGWKNWGIGFLIAALGYLTALPVYGIASEVSSNRRVGEVAALTYLLNPLMLYHTDFLWFNPAPFVFFFFAGFYMLVRNKRLTGTLLIVSAALFKQTAWFLGIPLVIYLLVKPRERKNKDNEASEPSDDLNSEDDVSTNLNERFRANLQPLIDYFDYRNFLVSVISVLIFVGAVMLPFFIAQLNFWRFWRLALGSFTIEDFTKLPPYNVPMRLQVLAIVAGKPELAKLLDTIIVSGGPLMFGVILCAGLMVLLDKFIGEEKLYLRRLLFLTLLLMLTVTLFGPRGVFKYYFVMLMPFFSIFSSARMIRGSGDHVPFSASMVWLPITLTLLILIPDRNIYMAFVLLIFLGYLLTPLWDRLYHLVKAPCRLLKGSVQKRLNIYQAPFVVEELPFDASRKRYTANIITQGILLGLGFFLVLFGWRATQMALYVDMVTGLEVILVFSAAFVIGFQILSIAISITLDSKIRVDYANQRVGEFSSMTAVVIWVYSILSYFQSWPINQTPERHLIVLTSVFISLWAVSLRIKQGKRERIITDFILIGGLTVGLIAWSIVGAVNIFLLGSIGLCALIVHLLLVSVHYFDKKVEAHLDDLDTSQIEMSASPDDGVKDQ